MDRVDVAAETCGSAGSPSASIEVFPSRETHLGDLPIVRALPIRGRRLVGPWCFLDRYGPLSFTDSKPMDVATHPHIGLQTVTWLLDGEVVHKDSLQNESLLRAGGVNVMTSGGGIAHAEETPREHSGKLNGVQLWVALPETHRSGDAGFQHVQEVPVAEIGSAVARVFAGEVAGVRSPALHFSDILGSELQLHPGSSTDVALRAHYEHAMLLLSGDADVEGQPVQERMLYYLAPGRAEVCLRSRTGARLLLIGGLPFPEKILMWWNFVARTPEEIAQARADWEQHVRFGDVPAYNGPRLSAPPLAKFSPANPAS